MEKADLETYRKRWKAVQEIEARELRTASVSSRWRQLNAIRRLAMGLGLHQGDGQDLTVVYKRWAQLREQFDHA